MKVKELVDIYYKFPASASVSEAACFMDSKPTASVLVEEKNRPVGVLTERDLLRKVLAKKRDPEETKVKEIMNTPIISISEEDSVSEASLLMDKHNIRRLAVINAQGEIIGKITSKKIARNFTRIFAKKLRDKEFRGTVLYK